MQKIRVKGFIYEIRHAPQEGYRNTNAQGSLGHFRYVLADGRATFTLETETDDEAQVRDELEQLVQAWNISALLALGPNAFELIPEAGEQQSSTVAVVTQPLVLHDAYPVPDDIAVTPCVVLLAATYANQLHEPQNAVRHARACLAALEQWYAGRQQVAAALNVDMKVLNRLSAITREWGRDSAEKPRFSTWRASRWLNSTERAWLELTMRELTYRTARHAAGHVAVQQFSQLPG